MVNVNDPPQAVGVLEAPNATEDSPMRTNCPQVSSPIQIRKINSCWRPPAATVDHCHRGCGLTPQIGSSSARQTGRWYHRIEAHGHRPIGIIASLDFDLIVVNTNDAPSLFLIGDQATTPGTPLDVQTPFEDVDLGDQHVITAESSIQMQSRLRLLSRKMGTHMLFSPS